MAPPPQRTSVLLVEFMDAEKLLAKLKLEARAREKNRNEPLPRAIRFQTQTETKAEQNRKKLHRLRARTAEIEYELKLREQVEAEAEKCMKAERALRDANLTIAERKARDAEIRAGQIAFSHVVAENHPDWREHARAEFQNKGRK